MNVCGDKNPDEVMLNPEYLKSISDENECPASDLFLGRPLTKEELDAFSRHRRSGARGLTVRPMITVKEMGRKNKRPVLVPFIGIQGTF